MVENNKEEAFQEVYYFAYGVLFWISQYAYQPYLVGYLNEMHVGGAFSGIIIGSYGLFQMLLRIPIGAFSDRMNRQQIFIVVGNIMLVLSMVILVFIKHPVAVLASRLLSGFAAAIWICFIVVFQSRYKKHGSVYASAKLFSMTSSGRLGGIVIASIVFFFASLYVDFIVCLILSLAVLLMSFKIKDVKTETVLPVRQSIKICLANKELVSGSLIAIFFQMVVFSTIFGYSSQIVINNLGNESVGIMSIFSVGGMVIAALFFVKPMTEKLGIKKSLYIFYFFMLLYSIVLPHITNSPLMALVGFLGGCGHSCGFSTIMGYSISSIRDESKTLAMGIFQTSVGAGVFVGPIIVGIVLGIANITVAYYFTAILVVISLILSSILIQKK